MNYFAVVFEKKDHLIKKIPSLSELEKKTITNFFKNHANLEGKIDWNKLDKLTYKDFEKVMIKNVKIKSGSAKEGKDYIEIDSLDKINKAFIPLTWDGSKYLGSNAVGGEEGKWCISYRVSDKFWKIHGKHTVFIIYVTPTTKYAIQYSYDFDIREIWNRWNDTIVTTIFLSETGVDIKELANKNKRWLAIGVEKMRSLMFIPDKNGNIDSSYNKLSTLKGAPKEVGGNFRCDNNYLSSLEGAPEKVKGDFLCQNNIFLTSLEGAPKEVKGSFNCSNSKLTALKGAPKEVGENFYCHRNNLTSLEGAPKEVIGSFDCSYNELSTLKGAPHKVNSFRCERNQLTSLEGAPKVVERNFFCAGNSVEFTEDDVRAVCKVGGKIIV